MKRYLLLAILLLLVSLPGRAQNFTITATTTPTDIVLTNGATSVTIRENSSSPAASLIVTDFNSPTVKINLPVGGVYTFTLSGGALAGKHIGSVATAVGAATVLAIQRSVPVVINAAIVPAASSGGSGGAVSSVFGRTGDVLAASNDYAFSQLSGSANLATQVIGQLPIGAVGSAGLSGTSPIAINAAGAIGCVDCVKATAPGAGIAHFAGSTQAATSSAVNLANGDVTGQLPIGNVGSAGLSATAPIAISAAGVISSSAAVSTVGFTGGLISIANPTTTPALTVAGTSGGIVYFSNGSTWASSAALTSGGVVLGGGAGGAPTTNAGFAYSAGNVTCGIAGSAGCVITGAGATSGTATITWPAVAGTAGNAIQFSNTIQSSGGVTAGTDVLGGQSNSVGINGRSRFRSTADGIASISSSANGAGLQTQVVFGLIGNATNPEIFISGLNMDIRRGDGTTGGGTLSINGGTIIKGVLSASATLDFANQAAIGCNDLTITVTGAALGDSVQVGVPNGSVPNGTALFSGFVSSSNTVTVRYCNLVSGDPASGTFRATVTQF